MSARGLPAAHLVPARRARLLPLVLVSLTAAPAWAAPDPDLDGTPIVVADPRGNPAWGGKTIVRSLGKRLEEALGSLIPTKELTKAQQKLKLKGAAKDSPEGLAEAGRAAGAAYVLILDVTKKGWLYTANARLIHTGTAEVQMDFRSEFYKPQEEGADRGERIARKTIEKLKVLKAGGGLAAAPAPATQASPPPPPAAAPPPDRAPPPRTAPDDRLAQQARPGSTLDDRLDAPPPPKPSPLDDRLDAPKPKPKPSALDDRLDAPPPPKPVDPPARETYGAASKPPEPARPKNDELTLGDDEPPPRAAPEPSRASSNNVRAPAGVSAPNPPPARQGPSSGEYGRGRDDAPLRARDSGLGGTTPHEPLRATLLAGAGLLHTMDVTLPNKAASKLSYQLDPLALFAAEVEGVLPSMGLGLLARVQFSPVRFNVAVGDSRDQPGGSMLDLAFAARYHLLLSGTGREAIRLIPTAGLRLDILGVSQHLANLVHGSTSVAPFIGVDLRLPFARSFEAIVALEGGLVVAYSESPTSDGQFKNGLSFGAGLGLRYWLGAQLAIAFDARLDLRSLQLGGASTRQPVESEDLTDLKLGNRDLRLGLGLAFRL